MSDAIKAISGSMPSECFLDPKFDKPLYTLVRVKNWPYPVHYEFRSGEDALYVELHIESGKYKDLGSTFRHCAEKVKDIHGYKVEYFDRRDGRHRKVWPSLSVQLPGDVKGNTAAMVMRGLIDGTREAVSLALQSAAQKLDFA